MVRRKGDRDVKKPSPADQIASPIRFQCPALGCQRSFAQLWRLKVHYRAPPDVRGSGKERGHAQELQACPKCGSRLLMGKHHVRCSGTSGYPRRGPECRGGRAGGWKVPRRSTSSDSRLNGLRRSKRVKAEQPGPSNNTQEPFNTFLFTSESYEKGLAQQEISEALLAADSGSELPASTLPLVAPPTGCTENVVQFFQRQGLSAARFDNILEAPMWRHHSFSTSNASTCSPTTPPCPSAFAAAQLGTPAELLLGCQQPLLGQPFLPALQLRSVSLPPIIRALPPITRVQEQPWSVPASALPPLCLEQSAVPFAAQDSMALPGCPDDYLLKMLLDDENADANLSHAGTDALNQLATTLGEPPALVPCINMGVAAAPHAPFPEDECLGTSSSDHSNSQDWQTTAARGTAPSWLLGDGQTHASRAVSNYALEALSWHLPSSLLLS